MVPVVGLVSAFGTGGRAIGFLLMPPRKPARPRSKTIPRENAALEPMEALSVAELPRGENWRYEPKWDGFRCLASKDKDGVRLMSKSGKPLDRYFPDIVRFLETLEAETFILDGELVIAGEGGFSFADLQLRLHPAASRVAKLAAAQPATFILFDLLSLDGENLVEKPFGTRRKLLEKFFKAYGSRGVLMLSPQTQALSATKDWLDQLGVQLDGLVAKDITLPYRPGERVMQKYKFRRTADCVIGGFRYGAGSDLVGSLLLGLYDEEGLLHHVGFTSGIKREEKAALTARLEKLAGGPGFTGRAPGGPSRWSTERSAAWTPLKPKLVAEVEYDHVTDDRFRHGTSFLRWRSDKAPQKCTIDQLRQPKILPIE